MYNFPYVKSYEKLEELFEAVINNEVPEKFTYRYLAEIGFASSKDRDMLPALKRLGFIDSKGHPTELYRGLRDPEEFKQSLRRAIKTAYIDLFKEYPDAANVAENVSTGYFRKLTGASQQESNVYKNTFSELKRVADYKKEVDEGTGSMEEEAANSITGIKNTTKEIRNINLNINLPTTTDERVYKALVKHLKDLLAQ